MTLFLVDVSRYQVDRPDPLDLRMAQAARFHLVNIALNKGLDVEKARRYADWARELGMGVCGYWWLDGGTRSGAEQANLALRAVGEVFGGLDGVAHQVDCEDTDNPATERTWRDYVTAVQDGLGRHVVAYTGDWWWQPRGWIGADLTPYLMAQPNLGKPAGSIYPGDGSRYWSTHDKRTLGDNLLPNGYGGWDELSIMQYAVASLPGTGPCSLSAIRNLEVWTALTGGSPMVDWYLNPALTRFRAAVNEAYPARDKTSDGTIGDIAHQATTSDHNPDPDGSVDAWDMDVEVNGVGKPYTAEVEHLKRVFQAHESSRYWIHNRQIASRTDGWARRVYDGINPHDKHCHWNTREEFENSTRPWGSDAVFTSTQEAQLLAAAATITKYLETIAWRAAALEDGVEVTGGGATAGQPFWVNKQLKAIAAAVGQVDEATATTLAAKLDAILAAAVDDGTTTVTMSEADRAALATQLAGGVVAELGRELAD